MAGRWKILMSHICDTGQMSNSKYIVKVLLKAQKYMLYYLPLKRTLFHKLIFDDYINVTLDIGDINN